MSDSSHAPAPAGRRRYWPLIVRTVAEDDPTPERAESLRAQLAEIPPLDGMGITVHPALPYPLIPKLHRLRALILRELGDEYNPPNLSPYYRVCFSSAAPLDHPPYPGAEVFLDNNIRAQFEADAAKVQILAERLLTNFVGFLSEAYAEPFGTFAIVAPAVAPPTTGAGYNSTTYPQHYLDPYPEGVNARNAWGTAGGSGKHARIFDIENGWNLLHETIAPRNIQRIGTNDPSWDFHGNCVLGIAIANSHNDCTLPTTFAAQDRLLGVAPCANAVAVQAWWPACGNDPEPTLCPFTALCQILPVRDDELNLVPGQINVLSEGCVVMLETQIYYPGNYTCVPVEVEYRMHHLIKMTILGEKVSIVEAAGNGQYNSGVALSGLSMSHWPVAEHPFQVGAANYSDSLAIIVGSSIESLNHDPASNFGPRVNCFANCLSGGIGLSTSGTEGAPVGPTDYTNVFGQTSGATAVIGGVVASAQSMLLDQNVPASPQAIRRLLTSGTESRLSNSVNPIGRMPDLMLIADKVAECVSTTQPLDAVV